MLGSDPAEAQVGTPLSSHKVAAAAKSLSNCRRVTSQGIPSNILVGSTPLPLIESPEGCGRGHFQPNLNQVGILRLREGEGTNAGQPPGGQEPWPIGGRGCG